MRILIIFLFMINTLSILCERKLIQKSYYPYGRYGLTCFDSLNCYAVDFNYSESQLTTVYQSKDKGESWDSVCAFNQEEINPNIDGSHGVEKSFILDDSHFYFTMASDNGILIFTKDRGKTYESREVGFSGDVEELYMLDTLNGFATNAFEFYITRDGWNTWRKFITWFKDADSNKIGHQHFWRINDSIFYYFSGVDLKDKDGEWFDCISEFNFNTERIKPIFLFPKLEKDSIHSYSFFEVSFLNDSVGFAAGGIEREESMAYYDQIIFKTKDYGKTWYNVLDTAVEYARELRDIDMRDEKYGLAVGQRDESYETYDGGETWNYKPIEGAESFLTSRIEFAGQNCIFGSWGEGMFLYNEIESSVKDDKNKETALWQSRDMLYTSPEYIGKTLYLYDLLGNLTLTAEIQSEINISQLPQGLYFYRIEERGGLIKSGSFLVE